MKSLKEKIQDLDEKRGKRDIGEWADGFIENIVNRMKANQWNTLGLSEKQADKIDELWEKYCA